MGPPPFGDGNWSLHFLRWGAGPPSMGPPPFGDGNLGGWTSSARNSYPSMGPPPFGDGNLRGQLDKPKERVLQWGHRLSAMETRGSLGPREVAVDPSMGPPPFGDGNVGQPPDHIVAVVPSMGPPPFGDGNLIALASFGNSFIALQWGHRLSAMETSSRVISWGGGSCLQWGHRLSAMETSSNLPRIVSALTAFNGATAFRRWKLGVSACRLLSVGPSMGPPPFGDGNVDGVAYTATELNPSMGPPPFGDGNSGRKGSRRYSVNLQWGHRLSAMETALCGSPPSWIHAKARFFTRIGYRINDHASVAQIGFDAP